MPDALPFDRYRELIDDWDAFQAALARPLPPCVWAHPERIGGAELASHLAKDGYDVRPVSWLPDAFRLPPDAVLGGRWEFFAGLYGVQEETSLMAAALLAPQPGERVLDLCAAPGMKTARLALAMRQQGTLVANDVNRRRLKALRQTVERFGLRNVVVTNVDGANYPPTAGSFDRILVDVPCSCEGTSRRRPGLFDDDPDAAFSRRKRGAQAALLRKAVQLCRPGGRIVYATCTYAPEENELAVADVLAACPGHVRLLPADLAGVIASPGATAWNGVQLDPALALTRRIWPHQQDTGGFFLALLERIGEPADLPAPTHLPPVTPPAAWQCVAERFGLPAEAVADFAWYADETDWCLTAPGLELPVEPPATSVGLLALRTHIEPPCLGVPAALVLGHAATRNRLQLDAAQAAAYLRRIVFPISPEQAATVSPGYVLLAHDGVVIGLGLFSLPETGPEVRSLFPRRWKRTRRTRAPG